MDARCKHLDIDSNHLSLWGRGQIGRHTLIFISSAQKGRPGYNHRMNHAETVAKRVLEGVLPGTMEYQPEQSHGEYDFELRYHDRAATDAVEVTESVDRTMVQTAAAICGGRKVPVIWASKCKKSWVICPTRNARIGKIRKSADEYLSKVEQAGIEKFSWLRNEHQCVEDICRDLGIVSGSVIPTETSPNIRIQLPIGGGALGAITAVEAGEKEAWKQDNREKLGAANTAERHLVVYIDVANGLPYVALTDFDPPLAVPKLPPEITRLWLLAHGEEADEFVVWYGSAKEPWRSLRRNLPLISSTSQQLS